MRRDAAARGGSSARHVRRAAAGAPQRRPPLPVEPVGLVRSSTIARQPLGLEQARGGEHLGHDGAARGEHDLRPAGRRLAQPVPAGEDVGAQPSVRRLVAPATSANGAWSIGPGRQPQVEAVAVGTRPGARGRRTAASRAPARKHGSAYVRSGSSSPIDGVIVALVGAALGGQRHARRGAGDDEARAVVERVDRGRRGHGTRTGRTRCRSGRRCSPCSSWPRPRACSSRKRFISLMPSSMWRPGRRLLPPQQAAVAEEVGLLVGWNTPTLLIQPPRFVLTLTSGEVVTSRGPTSGSSASRSSSRPNVSCVLTGVSTRLAIRGRRSGRRAPAAPAPGGC